ncbi:MAG: MBL fold metallo-hydrolase [Opitutaceae bacterium]|nr:MBL fold metallo-hydrolase [Opitutaceae bacterium]
MKTPLALFAAAAAAFVVSPAAAKVVGRLHVNGPVTNATAKIEVTGGPIIYVDPAVLPATAPADADFILITHNHGDHQELASINRIRKPGTVIYSSPAGVPALTTALAAAGVTINAVTPGQRFTIGGVEVETVPMYNLVRPNPGHPRVMNFVGYVINVGGVRVYASGDTERIPEMRTFSVDVALLPLGQRFTMIQVQDAVEAALDLRARVAIPYHYGRGEGTIEDGQLFASTLANRMTTMMNTGADGFPLEISETVAFAEHPASTTVAPGANATLSVQATGSGPLRYQWRRNGVAIVGATAASLPITAAAAVNAGDYTVIVSDANGPLTSRMARVAVEAPRPGTLINMSVRAAARAGGTPLIVGAVTVGGPKQLLIRGAGPALAAFGVAGTMPDPRLELHATVNGADTIVASNDNWATAAGGIAALRAAFTATGAFDFANTTSLDAALLATIDGPRTIHVVDTAGRPGVALIEVYDAQPGAGAVRLANFSARNFVGTGEDALIAGFVVSGNVPKRLLIRGVGPRLAALGVTGALADPRVELFLADGTRSTLFAANDNWAEGGAAPVRAAFAAVAAFDLPDATSRDAALVVTAPAGAYTAQVTGVGGGTGEALVEIYELP